jgi:hypothetical protein
MRPVTRQFGMVSFMRLIDRRKVDLPQPDGTDQGGDGFFRHVERDVEQGLLVAIEDRDLAGAGRVAVAVSMRREGIGSIRLISNSGGQDGFRIAPPVSPSGLTKPSF